MPLVNKLCLAEVVTWGVSKKDLRMLKGLLSCPSGEHLVRNSATDGFLMLLATIKHLKMCLKNISLKFLRIYFTVRS